MSDFDKDKSIDDAWLQDLYQSSSRDEQTPNSLDQEILELAAKKSRSTGTWLRWSAPLATAAVVLVSVSVYLNQPSPLSEPTADVMLLSDPKPTLDETSLSLEEEDAPVPQTIAAEKAPRYKQTAATSRTERLRQEHQEHANEVADISFVSIAQSRFAASEMQVDEAMAEPSPISCESEFELPEGADKLPVIDESEVRFQFREQTFTARCENGEWNVTPKTDL